MESLEYRGARATFAHLADFEGVAAVAARDAASLDDGKAVQHEATEFTIVRARMPEAPGEAVVDAWGLLEYQLTVAADRLDADQPHGWPQVAHTLEKWDKWPMLKPAVMELRRLRDYTVRSNHQPSSEDAARYVALAQDIATTVMTSFPRTASIEQAGRR
jgi:hypothetical protein